MPDFVKRGLALSVVFFVIAYLSQPSSFKVSNPRLVPIKDTSIQGAVAISTPIMPIESVNKPTKKVHVHDSATNTVNIDTVNQNIVAKIRAAFPEDPETAVAISQCESGLNQERIGDHNIAVEKDGELVGRSIGLFQIRTGEARPGRASWNRAHANGLSVAGFEDEMKHPDKNIKAARKLWEGGGWSPWRNCAIKVGAL